jgi:hypothetical protein
MKRLTMITLLLAAAFVMTVAVSGPASAYTFDQVIIDFWTDDGSTDPTNEAVIVVDWNQTNAPTGGYVTESHAFGYRWTGTSTAWAAMQDLETASGGALDFTSGGSFLEYAEYNDGTDFHSNKTPTDYWGWFALGDSADGITWTANAGIGGNLIDGWFFGINSDKDNWTLATLDTPAVPIPAAVWLLGSGLLGLVGIRRRQRS